MKIKIDPIEETEQYKQVVKEVDKKAEELVDPNIRYGRSFFVELEKKKILKEEYNIDWHTTEEMNPEWDFI